MNHDLETIFWNFCSISVQCVAGNSKYYITTLPFSCHIIKSYLAWPFTTVSASIPRRRPIKKLGFLGGGLLKWDGNLFNFWSKKPQKVDFWAKKWRLIWILIKFCSSGGFIKSGVVLTRIRYYSYSNFYMYKIIQTNYFFSFNFYFAIWKNISNL